MCCTNTSLVGETADSRAAALQMQFVNVQGVDRKVELTESCCRKTQDIQVDTQCV